MQYDHFPQIGLVLIGPTSPDYKTLVTEIRSHASQTPLQHDVFSDRGSRDDVEIPEDPSKSVVFVNKSEKSVALLQMLWRFELLDGREIVGSCAWAGAESILLPFGYTSEMKAATNYMSSILPGSKRYITNEGAVIGSNADVRPPAANEIWKGGLVRGFGGGGYSEPRNLVRVSISIEGAFFDDGEFAGTDRTKLYEQIVAKADAYKQIAEIASPPGKSAKSILDRIKKVATRAKVLPRPLLIPDENTPESIYRQIALRELADTIDNYRAYKGDLGALDFIRSWARTEIPTFRKLSVAVSKSVL